MFLIPCYTVFQVIGSATSSEPVRMLVGLSVCYNFLSGRKVKLLSSKPEHFFSNLDQYRHAMDRLPLSYMHEY